MRDRQKRVLIVGGGITGLSAAFYVRRLAAAAGKAVRVTIVEKEQRMGGKIETLRRDGFVMEAGPDSFLARKQPIIDITRELGLEEELVGTNPQAKKTYILRGGTLHRMPPGVMLGVPTRLAPLMKSGLLSPLGKVRAAMDLVAPRRNSDGDEALGELFMRRFGKELHDWLAEPILAGIYAGDTRKLSIQATFPQFAELERTERSLIRGMRRQAQASAPPPVAKGSVFLSYRRGLSTLIEALLEQLEETELVSGDEVVSLTRNGERYHAATSGDREWDADAVVLALPAFALPPLLPEIAAAKEFGAMPYISVANVLLAYRRGDVGVPLDGSGFVVPRNEGRFITACTWTSSKWGHTAPEDKVLIRCYVGRAGDQRWLEMDESEVMKRVMKDVAETTGIRAEPLFTRINPLHRSMPQYEVGHLERIERLRREMADRVPGVFATGSAFHGVGIPDCVRQGKEAAAAVCDFL